MSQGLRLLLVLVAFLTALWILYKIRKLQVKMRDSIFWIVFAIILLVMGVFPQIVYWLCSVIGIMSPANLVFVIIIALLAEKLFTLSIVVSVLEDKVESLSIEVALRSHDSARRLNNHDDRMDKVEFVEEGHEQ